MKMPNRRKLASSITPLVLTFNEAPNILRVLEMLQWAERVLIIDSGSDDGTLEILARNSRVEVIHKKFDSFAEQCNFGLSQIKTKWVLSLDADYELSRELVEELQGIDDTDDVAGYCASFIYCVYGKPLRGTLYPRRIVLHRVHGAHYVNEGHGHKVSIAGKVKSLKNAIYHDDRKPLSRWLESQKKYARLEAEYLIEAPFQTLSWYDRVRRTGWLAPILVLPYVLFVKGCLLNGRAGWFYGLQRLAAETIIALELIDQRFVRAGRDWQSRK